MLNKFNMEKHTRGLKDERIFCKSKETNEPFELIAISDNDVVLRNLIDAHASIVNAVKYGTDYVGITQGEVFDCIDNNDDEQHADMMYMLGIGYICPFCGGRLHWESDFMASEVHGCGNYFPITDEARIKDLEDHFEEYKRGNIAGETNDIDKEIMKFDYSDSYDYAYMREKKMVDGVEKTTYYEIDDSVIGIYRCSNCGKSYEIQDCPPSEQNDYPYFNDSE